MCLLCRRNRFLCSSLHLMSASTCDKTSRLHFPSSSLSRYDYSPACACINAVSQNSTNIDNRELPFVVVYNLPDLFSPEDRYAGIYFNILFIQQTCPSHSCLSYPEFPDSCLRQQLAFLIDISICSLIVCTSFWKISARINSSADGSVSFFFFIEILF